MKIVFASYNSKKTAEIQRMAPDDMEIVCLKDIPEAHGLPQASEWGSSFIENATIKAIHWNEILKVPVLAEDSGIMIDALNGYPGVYTKRCVEELCPGSDIDVDNPDELYPALLKMMDESGNKSKNAQFICAMALIDGEKGIFAQERLQGNMCEKAGERVFGFDQYFKPVGSEKTLSELSPEEKDNIAPRKEAFERIIKQIGVLS